MFKFLKDKLKKAVSKFTKDVEEEAEDIEEVVEEPVVEKPKKVEKKKKITPAGSDKFSKPKPKAKKEKIAKKEKEPEADVVEEAPEEEKEEPEAIEEEAEKEDFEAVEKEEERLEEEVEELEKEEEKEIVSEEKEEEADVVGEPKVEEEPEEEKEEALSPDLLGLKESLDAYSEEEIDSIMDILGFDADAKELDLDDKIKQILKKPLLEINSAIEKLDEVSETEDESEDETAEVFDEIEHAEKSIREKKADVYVGDEEEEKEFEVRKKTYDEEVDEEAAAEGKEDDVYEEYEPEELEEEEKKKAEAAKPKKRGFFKKLMDKISGEEYDDEYELEEKKEEKEPSEKQKEKSFRKDEQDWYEGEEKDTKKAFEEESDEEEPEPVEEEKEEEPEEEKEDIETRKKKLEKDVRKLEGKEEEPEEEEPEEEPEDEEPEEEPEEEEEPKGFFGRLKATVTSKKLSESKFEDIFFDLEVALLENNVAVEVIEKIKDDLRERLVDKKIKRSELENTVFKTLRKSLDEILSVKTVDILKEAKGKKPFIITFVGINGSGKTTTIAKMAKFFMNNGMKPVMVAADTFRAAAIQQLEEHANRLGVKMIKHDYGSDPAAVAFDGVKYAESKGIDVVLIDTAGRLHSNVNLMDEMKKIMRVAKPDMKIFIGESITGNDCIEQAKEFNDAIDIDGIVLSKADVDEKGGAAISVSYVTGKPILFLGTGQEYDDLQKFSKSVILENLGL